MEKILKQNDCSFYTLCTQYTELSVADIDQLQDMADKLLFIAELTETDIFIDALTSNGVDAIVLAWAHPPNRSVYRQTVVGQLAYATREPAVYQAFTTQKSIRNVRGISQEDRHIDQTVVPLWNKNNQVIGVLIMERDISKEIRQEEQMKFLSQTADQLSSKLMSLSMTGLTWKEWLGNGVFVIDRVGQITYANQHAEKMYLDCCDNRVIGGDLLAVLAYSSLEDLLTGMEHPLEMNFEQASYLMQAQPLTTCGKISGGVVSFQDITKLREKEREINAQNIIIRETHHRVKNNLQNVVSLLRLQMGNSQSEVVRREFETCIQRILSIARVHDVFAHQSVDYIDIFKLAEDVLAQLVQTFSFPEQRIRTAVRGQAVKIPASQAVPIALVINELVTNSLKHGIKIAPYGEISILLEKSEDHIYILLADSGMEPLLACRPENGQLGLYIVNLLICEQLDGTFSLERCGGSTVAKVSFPLRKAEDL
jgi:two-component sensor histidine kinase/PAS domain-containing protein